MRSGMIWAALGLGLVSAGYSQMLPTGKAITPAGSHKSVGSYPINMILSRDGKFAVVTNTGFRQYLSVVDTTTGKVVAQWPFNTRPDGLYFGLALNKKGTLFVSRGAQDKISRFILAKDGMIGNLRKDVLTPAPAGSEKPFHIAGLALSPDERTLYATNNQSTLQTAFNGSVSVIDAETGTLKQRFDVPGFPFAIAADSQRVYVACERDGLIAVHSATTGQEVKQIMVGSQPAYLLLDSGANRLFVANSGSDSVSEIDTKSLTVKRTFLVRPPETHGIPGVTPLGLAFSPDKRRLYVALADMNAVAVLNRGLGKVEGYIPTGWYPTSLVTNRDGTKLLVASAKGVRAMNPNGRAVGGWGQYIQNIIEGSVSLIAVPKNLAESTKQVKLNNRIGVPDYQFKNPGIKHVIYVVKENRTYDQVLGDVKKGNGDPGLCFFPQRVTPNQHALAERFVLLDNFYVCAEVSADGWNWSTAGMVSAYTSRNTPYNYSGRGRSYDFEGTTNGVAVDLLGIKDVATPPSGYIWDLCAKNGVTFRNYGFFVAQADPDDKRYTKLNLKGNSPVKKALLGHTCTDFQEYDLTYADSEAYLKHGLSFPRQRKAVGDYKSPSRFTTWKREFDQFVKQGKLPQFMMVRFPVDHTAGTSAGYPSMPTMVADNDYAVGQLVEAVSKSPFWKETLICILEDDAQAGFDHVDAHRSTAYLVSPYIKKGTVDSRFYNTDSMLRTMELMLGMPPMNLFDAVARPFDIFGSQATNFEPFTAILPPKELMAQVNSPSAYRSRDSLKLFPARIPDPGFDHEQNDVIWNFFKPGVPKPKPLAFGK